MMIYTATIPPSLPDVSADTLLLAANLIKGFTLHHQGGIHLSVLKGVSLTVKAGECVALVGASGFWEINLYAIALRQLSD